MSRILKIATMIAAVSPFMAVAKNYDSQYTAQTGYVTLEKSDNSTTWSFASAGNWSDTKEPHSGTNYYVGVEKTLGVYPKSGSLNEYKFPGNLLVVAGEVKHSSAAGNSVKWGETRLLPGSKYILASKASINEGDFIVEGTVDDPFTIGVNSTHGAHTLAMNVSSLPSGYMKLNKIIDNDTLQKALLTGDWSRYYGTLECAAHPFFQTLLKQNFDMPGKIVVPENGTLALQYDSNKPVIASIDVKCGGKILFVPDANDSYLHVTNQLSLESGAVVDSNNKFTRVVYGGNEPTHTTMVFRLSSKVAEGLKDFDWNSIDFIHRKERQIGELPYVVPFVVDDTEVDGGKYVGLRARDCSVMTNLTTKNNYFIDAFSLDSNPAENWSGGRLPEPGFDYLATNNVKISGVSDPYIFPGESFTLQESDLAIHKYDVTFANLVAVGDSKIKPYVSQKEYHLRGHLKLMKHDKYQSPAKVMMFNKMTLNIDSVISGNNDLYVYMKYEEGKGLFSLLSETMRLSGLNTGWTGKIFVSAVKDEYTLSNNKGTQKVDADHNVTLRISEPRNLGGELPEFAYDSLTVSNHCRLAIDKTAKFTDSTRGWFFPATAYLYVTNNAVATCANTITLGGNLVKEGAGTLCVAAPIAKLAESTPSVTVEDGVLAASVSDAFKNVLLNIKSGSALGIDTSSKDSTFAEKGLDLANLSITSESEAVPLCVCGVDKELGAECGPLALFTSSPASVDTDIGRFIVKNPWSGRGVQKIFTKKDNGDGTVTVSVKFRPCSLRVIIR